jgi:hypothetical protein
MSGAQVRPLLKTGGRTPDPAIPSWLRMRREGQRSTGSSWRGSHRGETCRPARLSRCSARSRDHPKAPSQRETPRRSRHPPQPADDSPSRYSRRRDTNRAQERPASRMPRTQPTQQQTRTNVPCRLRAQDASQLRDTANVRSSFVRTMIEENKSGFAKAARARCLGHSPILRASQSR